MWNITSCACSFGSGVKDISQFWCVIRNEYEGWTSNNTCLKQFYHAGRDIIMSLRPINILNHPQVPKSETRKLLIGNMAVLHKNFTTVDMTDCKLKKLIKRFSCFFQN